MVKTTHDRSQAGFTLVELAIVMIIIGLLIGGILKGQELINNAQVTATASQVKAIEAAMSTFRDSYNAVPGDMTNPGSRLPNCTAAPCSTAGNGNNRLDNAGTAVTVLAASAAGENTRFWTHLAAADMIGGVDPTSAVITSWDGQLPSAEIGGGFTATYAATTPGGVAGTLVAGHYLTLRSDPGAISSTTNLALTPTQAGRVDRKLDNGDPTTGSTQAIGAAGGANCWTAATGTSSAIYNEANSSPLCGLVMRFQ